MKLTIDNLDDLGARDYTQFVDGERLPKVVRKLNRPSRMTLALAGGNGFRVPATGAKVRLEGRDGQCVFTGYLEASPDYEFLGTGERGSVYRYHLKVIGEEYLLDRKAALSRAPFTIRSAGEIAKILAEDLCSGVFGTSEVDAVATMPRFRNSRARKWSEQVSELAVRSRAAYRVHDSNIRFREVGQIVHELDERSEGFTPEALRVERLTGMLNDVTIVGRSEPDAYVRDYFLGDGYSLRFTLSEMPFLNRASTVVEEEYEEDTLRPQYWRVVQGRESISVSGGKLRINVETGPSATEVLFVEKFELAGANQLQHGDFEFTAASAGIIGGLYLPGAARDAASCVAGFRVEKAGSQSTIRALVGGVVSGNAITTVAGRKYVLSTRIYANEVYRMKQSFRSASECHGGQDVASSARFLLEVHEIDPANPATLAEPAKVLYDGVVSAAPGYCEYALVSGGDLHCKVAYTRLRRIPNVEVRSALQGQSVRPRLLGTLSDGGECSISTEPALYFYAAHPPMPNEAIMANYRSSSPSVARLVDTMSIAAQSRLNDDGVRSAVIEIVIPEPRTSDDCANAARALLDDSTRPAWIGQYEAWSGELEREVFPGDAVRVNAASRGATFDATIREVEVEVFDLESDLTKTKIHFANDAAQPLAYAFERVSSNGLFDVDAVALLDTPVLVPDLPTAEVKVISSTFVTLDAGRAAPQGGGFEVRRSNFGWGATNDRNLIGRFTTVSFNVPRISRVQDYWVRMYDAQNNYSQHSTLLHIDYPL